MELGIKDRRILFELDKNARQPISQLAKRIQLSQQVADYRLKNLIKRKIILDFLTVINYKKLGYTAYLIYYRLKKAPNRGENYLISLLKENKNVVYLAKCLGRYDLIIGILAKDIFELDTIVQKIELNFSESIKEKISLVHIGAHQFERNYLINKKILQENEIVTGEKVSKNELKKDELELLERISSNARMNAVELSKYLKVPPSKIIYSLKKLRKEKIILGFTSLIDSYKFGLNYYRILIKTRRNIDTHKIIRFCKSKKNVFRISRNFGEWQYTLEAEIEEEKFKNFLNDLKLSLDEDLEDYEVLKIENIAKLRYIPSN